MELSDYKNGQNYILYPFFNFFGKCLHKPPQL